MSLSFWITLAVYAVSIIVLRRTRFWTRLFLEPMAMWSMIAGIAFICQPWMQFLYRIGLTVLIFGLLFWNIAVNMNPKNGG